MVRFLSTLLIVCALPSAVAAKLPPAFNGYVTNIVSPAEFDVGSQRVLSNADTLWQRDVGQKDSDVALRVGMPVHVEGAFGQSKGPFVAGTIRVSPPVGASDPKILAGRGLIQQAPELKPAGQGWAGTLWVDGYPIKVNPATRLLDAAGKDFAGERIETNVWADYTATRQVDGSILASQISLAPNVVDEEEKHFRDREWPKYLPPDPAQQAPAKIKFGPHLALSLELLADDQVQNYVARVGNSLVPAYQRDMAASDPAKIDFRFYVFKRPSKWKGTFEDAIDLSGGMVLVPDNVLAALENEAQLAALLSNCIAGILEKQVYLHRTRLKVQSAAALAGNLAALFPLEVLPVVITNDLTLQRLMEEMQAQASRIGLTYMAAQGYDLREAPYAWTVAANRTARNPMKIGEIPSKLTVGLMETLRQDYANTDYARMHTNKDEFLRVMERLKSDDKGLKKPKNRS